MRRISLGSPIQNLPGSFQKWATAALKEIENASYGSSPASLVNNDSSWTKGGASLTDVLNGLGARYVIGDDGFATVSLAAFDNSAAKIEFASSVVGGPNGSLWARCDATNACVSIAFAAGPTLTFTTGALGGTTGTDGHVTMSAGTDGKCYIENRSGATLTVTVRVLGA